MGAEVHEAGHENDAGRDVGRVAHHRADHGAKAGSLEIVLGPTLELRGNFVPPTGILARRAGNGGHVVQAERQQHGLLGPLVDLPAIAAFLRHAELTAIERGQGRLNGITHLARGRRRDLLAGLPSLLDNFSQSVAVHSFLPASGRSRPLR